MSFSTKTRVGVLRGGPSSEYDVSLNTGKTVLANLPENCEPIDIFISKEGLWHTCGIQKDPYQILRSLDLVFNALHGTYGEDGEVQKLLNSFNIPYTGSKHLPSFLGMNKHLSKNIFSQSGLKTPPAVVVEKMYKDGDVVGELKIVKYISDNLPLPIILKPINSGSSVGVFFVENLNDLRYTLRKAFEISQKVLAEEFIFGKEATCGVIENFRNQEIYKMLPVEVLRAPGHFHDYDSKYLSGEPKYVAPGNFSFDESDQVKEAAALIHQILDLKDYSRSDFIINPKRGVFVLEVNTLPELTHKSAFVKSLEATGSNLKEFLSHLVSKTLGKNNF